jgi:hypothetical protein
MTKVQNRLKEVNSFEFQGNKFKLVEPSAAVIKEARKRRGIKFVEAIKSGMFTKKELEDALIQRTPDLFLEINKLREEIVENITETEELLEGIDDPEQLESLSYVLIVYRAQLVEQEQSLKELYDSTAEEIADEEKSSFLVYSMLRDEEGNKLAEDYDTFMTDISFEFFDHCKYQLLCWEHNLDPDWQEKLPEAQAVIKAQDLRLKEEEEAEKKRTIAKKKAAPKKKTATKKTTSKTATRKRTPRKKAEPAHSS